METKIGEKQILLTFKAGKVTGLFGEKIDDRDVMLLRVSLGTLFWEALVARRNNRPPEKKETSKELTTANGLPANDKTATK